MSTLFDATVAPEDMPATIETTLYDLMEAMQEEADPDEEEIVVTSVLHLLRSGRIAFLGDRKYLSAPFQN
jgi:hypothetical protein